MRKTIAVLAVATMGLLWVLNIAYAQGKDAAPEQAKSASQDSKPAAERSNTVVTPYRLDFSFYELVDGKKINTRHYTLDLTAGSGDDIKIGTRVPVANGPSASPAYSYMDVGTRIWANLAVLGGGDVRLDVRSDVSDLDLPADHDRTPGPPPIVRQIQINGSTLLVTGKPILLGSMDDPNSNRQFQLEVTATKLK